MRVRNTEKVFIIMTVMALLAVGIIHSTPMMIPTPSLSSLSVSKPTPPQHDEPMDNRILPYEPALIVQLPAKKENKIEEDCPHCCEIPVIGIDGKMTDVIKVHLYNTHKTTFNKQDASLYFSDVYRLLKIYYVDGVWCSAVLAQAYTEGGAGKTGVYANTNNLFGMRASSTWDGYVYARSTQTVYKSYEVAKKFGAKDLFRAYGSINESIRDYLKLVQRDNYKSALSAKSPRGYLKVLLKNGYGTPSMLGVWSEVIEIFDLTTYDKEK